MGKQDIPDSVTSQKHIPHWTHFEPSKWWHLAETQQRCRHHSISNVGYVCKWLFLTQAPTLNPQLTPVPTYRKPKPAPPKKGKHDFTNSATLHKTYTTSTLFDPLKWLHLAETQTAISASRYQQCRLYMHMDLANPNPYTKPSAYTCTYIQEANTGPKKWLIGCNAFGNFNIKPHTTQSFWSPQSGCILMKHKQQYRLCVQMALANPVP